MARVLIGLFIGLIVGGIGTFYFFVGAPPADQLPGQPIASPDPNGYPPSTARIVLRQEFFNQVLTSIFDGMDDPTFALTQGSSASSGECSSTITMLQEGSGVRTAVSLESDRLEAPIAFAGSYSSAFGCFRFNGWANSVMELRYDAATQSVLGQVNVETVNLEGVNPFINAIVTPLVQSSINTRVNPIRIVEGSQLRVNAPIVSANGNLIATVSDVRAEVKDRELNLYVSYDLKGGTTEAPQPLN